MLLLLVLLVDMLLIGMLLMLSQLPLEFYGQHNIQNLLDQQLPYNFMGY
jgi:hypothetical protein